MNEETGIEEQTSLTATCLPQLALHLEDRNGQLFESEKSRFFQVGKDILPTSLKWRGIFKVIPRSLVGDSEIIMRQTKTEMANMLIPLLSLRPEIAYKPAKQLCKINEEDERDWLPDLPGWNGKPIPTQEQPKDTTSLFVPKEANIEANTIVPKGEVSSPTKNQVQGGGMGSLFRK
jgi:hypothetical protein